MVFPQEMRYVWILLRARTKGPKVTRDDLNYVTGDFTPSLHKASALECSGASRERLDNLRLF